MPHASQIATETRNNSSYVWTGGVNVARNYTVNGLNQYLSAGPASFGYDANGNLTSDGTSAYIYDAENRLVSSSASGGTTLSYDPLGRLWKIWSQQTGTTSFVYEGDHVSAEYDWSGTMLRRYFWGPGADEPIIQDEGGALTCGGTRFLHANHQGSIIAASNCDGNLTAINRYDEYGIPQGNWGRFQYTGQAWLPELGMYYYKARIYSATLGRFLQTDPIGYDDQVNLYAYVGNDPINNIDPTGMQVGPLTPCGEIEKDRGRELSSCQSTTGFPSSGGESSNKKSRGGYFTQFKFDLGEELDESINNIRDMGLWGEVQADAILEKDGFDIIGRNFGVLTDKGGLRYIDRAAMKDGRLFLIEIKVNGSNYTSRQLQKDRDIAVTGGFIMPNSYGKNPALARLGIDRLPPTNTVVFRIKCSFLGWSCIR